MSNIDSRVVTEIRVQLVRRNLEQNDLALILGMGREAIYKKMKGRTPFRLSELETIAAAWGIPVAALLGEPAVAVLPPSSGAHWPQTVSAA